MPGWLRAAAARASCSKRERRSGSAAYAAGMILIATSRFSRVSRARYTSPIPPSPSFETTSYGPIRLPITSSPVLGYGETTPKGAPHNLCAHEGGAAGAERGDDFIGPESSAGIEGH